MTFVPNRTKGALLTSDGYSNILFAPATDGYFLSADSSTEVGLKWSAVANAGANAALSNLTSTSINASLIPGTDNIISLGDPTHRWKDGYFGPNSIHLKTTDAETTTARDWRLGVETSGIFSISDNSLKSLNISPDGYVGLGLDGSAGNPTLYFSDTLDTDTGLFHPADNSIAFSTAGAERLRINAGSAGPILDVTLSTQNSNSGSYVRLKAPTIAPTFHGRVGTSFGNNYQFSTNYYYDGVAHQRDNTTLGAWAIVEAVSTNDSSSGIFVNFFNAATGAQSNPLVVRGSGQITALNGTAAAPTWTFASDVSTGVWMPSIFTMAVSTIGVERQRWLSNGTISMNLDGSASAPTLTFGTTADADTGIFHPATDTLSMSAGGTERFRVATGTADAAATFYLPNSIGNASAHIKISSALASTFNSYLACSAGNNYSWSTNVYWNGSAYVKERSDLGAWLVQQIVSASENGHVLDFSYFNIASSTLSRPLRIFGNGQVVFQTGATTGTAAAPTITFDGDLDIGIFRAGADILGMATAGVERQRWLANGTISMSLDGSAANPTLTFGTTTDVDTGIFHPAADVLAISTGAAERIRFGSTIVINENSADQDLRVEGDTDQNLLFIDASTDRVGIGTATPSRKLHVDGYIFSSTSGFMFPDGSVQATASSGSGGGGGGGGTVTGTGAAGQISYWSGTSAITGESALFWDATLDRLGIGTNSPGSTLDVRGTVILNEDGGDFDVRMEGDTDANLFFLDASTDRIGIGTNIPGSKFSVAGNIATTGTISAPGAGTNSERFGLTTLAAGNNSVAVGNTASAATANSVVVGQNASVAGTFASAIVIGQNASASATDAGTVLVIGASSSANFRGVVVGNASSIADSGGSSGSVVIGSASTSSITTTTGNRRLIFGGGSSITGGDHSIAIGNSNAISVGASLAIGAGITIGTANTAVIGGAAASTAYTSLYFNAITSATPMSIVINGSGGSGTNIAGASMTFAGGRSTGSGLGGGLVFQTNPPGSSGSTLNTLITRGQITTDGYVAWGTATSPTSTISLGGSHAVTVTTISTSTTLDLTHHIVLANAASGLLTLTLPAAAACVGRKYTIKKIDAVNNVEIDPNASETIDGVSTNRVLTTQWETVRLVNNGTAWFTI